MRKIIQISGANALCDDGSAWLYCPKSGYQDNDGWKSVEAHWVRLIDIPQDELTQPSNAPRLEHYEK